MRLPEVPDSELRGCVGGQRGSMGGAPGLRGWPGSEQWGCLRVMKVMEEAVSVMP